MDKPSSHPDEQHLDEIIASYISLEESGHPLDRQALLAQHPELAAGLRQFFADRDQFRHMARPLGAEPTLDHPAKTVRYFGDYQLIEEVARGGMGIVYRARQTSLNRIVALKMILAGHLASDEDVQRFRSEAKAAANLQHPSIVAVHEVGIHDGQHYFSMDLIDGRNLEEFTRSESPSPRQAAKIIKKITEAVHHAHQQGIVHRDLKPSNVLIDDEDGIHVTDFGLAMQLSHESGLTRTNQVLGSPSYMSPEQAEGKRSDIGPASDVYALGAMLYELLTGRPPFRAETSVDTLRQVLETEPIPPRKLQPRAPRDLETICLKCLEKQPARRYGSAALLADDLGRFLAGEPIQARPVGKVERVGRWCQRNPVVATLTTLSVALLVAVAGLAGQGYLNELNRRIVVEALVRDLDQAEAAVQSLDEAKQRLTQQKASLTQEKGELTKEKTQLQQNVEQLTTRQSELDQKYYVTLMSLARNEWYAENVVAADLLLEDCPQHLRDQVWQNFKLLVSPPKQRFKGSHSVAVSPDRKRLAAQSGWGVIQVWEIASERVDEKLTLPPGGRGPIRSLAFSPDGKRLAAARGTRVYLWSLQGRGPPRVMDDHQFEVTDVNFHPKRSVLASASHNIDPRKSAKPTFAGETILWDLDTGKKTNVPGVRHAVFDPEGKYLVTGGYSRDGRRFSRPAEGFQTFRMAHIWDLSKAVFDNTAVVKSFLTDLYCPPVFTPDGNHVAYLSSESEVEVWGFEEERLVLKVKLPRTNRLAFSRDGRRLACGASRDKHGLLSGSIAILNLAAAGPKERVLPAQDDAITDLVFAGDKLIAADDGGVTAWYVPPPTNATADIETTNKMLHVGPRDYAMWGGSNSRVNAPPGKNIPLDWRIGEFLDAGQHDIASSKNVRWVAAVGSQTYGNPVVANGKVFVGTNNGAGYLETYPSHVDLGVLLCFDEATGAFLWQQSNEKLKTGRVHDWPLQGVCSTPVVDGDRLWFVTNRGETLCLDTEGFLDGEDDGVEQGIQISNKSGTTVDESQEADVVWRFDMMSKLDVSPHNMSNCSVVTANGNLYVCTSNGLDESHINLPRPDAPSFICLDRETAEVLWTSNIPGKNILHAQWGSPSYGVFDGQAQVIFPAGDGWVYSFDPEGDGQGNAKLLWKFDGNSKESEWILGGRGTRNNIIAFPAIYDGLVYITMGQDPEHGEGQGRLWCIDPTGRGDVSAELAVDAEGNILPHRRLQAVDRSKGERAVPNPKSAVIWQYDRFDQNGDGEYDFEEEFHRSLGIPAIKDDILYIADFSGLFHCLHAKTGHVYWTYDMFAACWGSALVVDGKVYIGDEDGELSVFRHSASRDVAMKDGIEPINVVDMGNSLYTTPIVANDTLFIANCTHLFAIADMSADK